MNTIQIIAIITGVEAFIAFLILLPDIKVFLAPQNYNKIIMLEADGNIKAWTQKKNKDNQFIFKDGLYNMFTGGKDDN